MKTRRHWTQLHVFSLWIELSCRREDWKVSGSHRPHLGLVTQRFKSCQVESNWCCNHAYEAINRFQSTLQVWRTGFELDSFASDEAMAASLSCMYRAMFVWINYGVGLESISYLVIKLSQIISLIYYVSKIGSNCDRFDPDFSDMDFHAFHTDICSTISSWTWKTICRSWSLNELSICPTSEAWKTISRSLVALK